MAVWPEHFHKETREVCEKEGPSRPGAARAFNTFHRVHLVAVFLQPVHLRINSTASSEKSQSASTNRAMYNDWGVNIKSIFFSLVSKINETIYGRSDTDQDIITGGSSWWIHFQQKLSLS